MESQVIRLKRVQALFLVLAILCTIMAVPMVGYLISIASFGLIHLLLLALAIITLIFVLRASAPRTGTLLVMTAVIPGMISAILMYNGIRIADQLGLNISAPNHVYEAMYSGKLTIFFIGFNIGIISWVLYLMAAILLFLNISNVRMRYKDLERGDSYLMETTKRSRAKNMQPEGKVAEEKQILPSFNEKMSQTKSAADAKTNKEARLGKISMRKKADEMGRSAKEKALNKSGAKAKTQTAHDKSKTAKPQRPLKAKDVSKKPNAPKKKK